MARDDIPDDAPPPNDDWRDALPPEPVSAVVHRAADPLNVPPNDQAAETAVLSVALLTPEHVPSLLEFLRPEHFFSEAHTRIWGAVRALAEASQPVEIVTVASWLRARDRLESVGGMPYLIELLNQPAIGNPVAYARIVHERWRARELIALAHDVAAHGYHSAEPVDSLLARALGGVKTLADSGQSDEWPSLEARALTMAARGPITRFATGLPTLDKACRGGIPAPRFVVLGGAPGAGKTSLAVYLAARWAREGHHVGILAVDEGPEGIIMRLAQMDGLSAGKLDAGDRDEWANAARRMAGKRILVADADDRGATVEGVALRLAKRAQGRPAVLIVDSIQNVRSTFSSDADDPRARVDIVVKALKAATMAHGFVTLATCELARGSYRSKDSAEQVNDLAAFKESGGIEYAAQTALVLRSVAGSSGLVDVTIPKNRALMCEPFRLSLNRETVTYREVEAPEPEERETVTSEAKFAAAVERVFAVIGTAGGATKREVRQLAGMKNDTADAALEHLLRTGRIRNEGAANAGQYRIV